jgi:hypothetical protein
MFRGFYVEQSDTVEKLRDNNGKPAEAFVR